MWRCMREGHTARCRSKSLLPWLRTCRVLGTLSLTHLLNFTKIRINSLRAGRLAMFHLCFYSLWCSRCSNSWGVVVRLQLRRMWKARLHVTLCCNINLPQNFPKTHAPKSRSELCNPKPSAASLGPLLAEEVPMPSKSLQKNLENVQNLDPSAASGKEPWTCSKCIYTCMHACMHACVPICEPRTSWKLKSNSEFLA